MPFLPYGRQTIDEEDIEVVAEVLRGDYLTTGPSVDAFERALEDFVGADRAVACSSGTAALHLAVLALGIEPDEVAIVPSVTFAATANAVRYVGGEVVFADVDPETGLMRPEDLEAAIQAAKGRKVRMILPVHYAGHCVDMPATAHLAQSCGAAVIEDASHAVGGSYRSGNSEWMVGASEHSDATVFSFHPVKNIAMGEGGAITTRDAQLADRMAKLRSHGIERDPAAFVHQDQVESPWYYELTELGFNYRVTDIQCALGLSQLKKLKSFVERRQELVNQYDALLKPHAASVRPIKRMAASDAAWHLYPVLIDFSEAPCDRAQLMKRLRERGVGTQVHYIPLHMQPYYEERYGPQTLAGAETFYSRVLSLPLYPQLTTAEQHRVVGSLAEILDS